MIRKILRRIGLDEILDKTEAEREVALNKWQEEKRHFTMHQRNKHEHEHTNEHGHGLDYEHHHNEWTY
jgi:hypothetical protein